MLYKSLFKKEVAKYPPSHRLEKLDGRTPMDTLEQVFRDASFTVKTFLDVGEKVNHLYFAHPSSIEMVHAHADVLLIVATYKTNALRIPLLLAHCWLFLNVHNQLNGVCINCQ